MKIKHWLLSILLLITTLHSGVQRVPAAYQKNDTSRVSGTIRDQQKSVINEVNISIFNTDSTGKQNLVTSTTSDAQGLFNIGNLPAGSYEMVVQKDDFQVYSATIKIKEGGSETFEITLNSNKSTEGFTVTATVNTAQEAFLASQQLEIATKNELNSRPGVLLPQLLQEEVGVRPAQGSTFYGSITIRGLTGQRVATLIDGVRFNNSTFTTALEPTIGLIDSNVVRQAELVYGPGSAVYGSDALAGTVNFLTDKPIFYKDGWQVHGSMSSFFGSANLAGGGNFKLNVGNQKFALFTNMFGQRINDLRAGDGLDSHSIATRFFNISSKALGDRLQDTGYLHYGYSNKIVAKLPHDQQISVFYQHTTQRNTRPYFVLNGGIGLNAADFSPQVLDFFYTRYEKQQLGLLDSLSGFFSLNRQRQRFNSQLSGAPISTDEYRLTKAYGYGLQATTHIGSNQFLTIGGEIYDERVTNRRNIINNLTVTPTLGTVPNGTDFTSYGAFIQDTVELIPGIFRLNGGVRYSAFFFKTDPNLNPRDQFGNFRVPLQSIRTDDVTFNVEGVYFIKQVFSLVANVSRGFRTPNVIDLGSSGGLPFGFEVLTTQAAALGGTIGSTADVNATTTGQKVSQLTPESLLNIELGAKYQGKNVVANVTFFNSTINDFITQRALILPQGAVGKTIGGLPIVSQNPITGTILIAGLRPVIVKANATDIRLRGIEASTQIKITNSLVFTGNFAYLRGIDKRPAALSRPLPGELAFKKDAAIPEVEGGLPPATGFLSLRYQAQRRNFWIEGYSNLASFQDRLSSLDIADVRIGSSRSRDNIAFFFNARARDLGLIGNGADNRPFTADDVLKITGETLTQVQNRVLGSGVNRAPLFSSTPGYATFNIRGGFSLGESSNVIIVLENILDKNYRIHGAGIDGAGRNLFVRYSWRF